MTHICASVFSDMIFKCAALKTRVNLDTMEGVVWHWMLNAVVCRHAFWLRRSLKPCCSPHFSAITESNIRCVSFKRKKKVLNKKKIDLANTNALSYILWQLQSFVTEEYMWEHIYWLCISVRIINIGNRENLHGMKLVCIQVWFWFLVFPVSLFCVDKQKHLLW